MSLNKLSSASSFHLFLASIIVPTMEITSDFIVSDNLFPYIPTEYNRASNTSGSPISFYKSSLVELSRTESANKIMNTTIQERQNRIKAIQQIFFKNNNGFPIEKNAYIIYLSESVSKLKFEDSVCYFNKFDNSIDTILKLKENIKVSISQFIDDEKDAPVVFSIHRGQTLLVSDELPIREIVDTINSVMEEYAEKNEA